MQVSLTSICQHQVTKQGSSKKAMIRLTCSDRETPVKLDFAKNWSDRDAFRDMLVHLQGGGGAQASQGHGGTRGTSNDGNRNQTAAVVKPMSKEERQKREKMLKYPDVRKLHLRLVLQTNALTDEEFWGAIKYKFKANGERRANVSIEQADDEVKGKGAHKGVSSAAFAAPSHSSQIQDIDPKTWSDGIPTPSQRHRIFLLLPEAARAYNALVPSRIKEKEFWRTLLDSSMGKKLSKELRFRRNQATANKADQLFAHFQASESTTAKREAKEREKGLHPSLDFRRFDDHRSPHVLEGHATYGDAPRQVSRPGDRDLPSSTHLNIMRDVNRHARLIVDDTFNSKNANSVAPRWEDPSEKGIVLEDLVEPEEQRFAELSSDAVQKATPVFQGDGTGNSSNSISSADVSSFTSMLQNWRVDSANSLGTIKGNGIILATLLDKMQP